MTDYTPTVIRTFGRNLRTLRIHACLYQRDLALVMDVCLNTVSAWERGKGLPTPANHAMLLDIFGDTALLDLDRIQWAEWRREAGRKPNRIITANS